MFRIYRQDVSFNGKHFIEVWIDPHYEEKHGESIDDELILELLLSLADMDVDIAGKIRGFTYYEGEVMHRSKCYRLILVTPPDLSYLGVRNTYRRS